MDDQRETRALDRLAAFEPPTGRPVAPGSPPFSAAPAAAPAPAGSPGWQFLVSLLLPGLAALRRRPVVAVPLFALGVAVPIALIAWASTKRDDLIGMALDRTFLGAVVAVGAALIVARIGAVAEVAYTFRHRAGVWWRTSISAALVLVLAAPITAVALRANDARGAVGNVFGNGGDDDSVFVPSTEAPDVPAAPGDDIAPDDITNILLLGGDAGPGRWGMRTDTMIIVSINETSGRAALISIPRNLRELQFVPSSPMGARFPDGFDAYQGLTNAVFTYVSGDEMLMGYYGRDGALAQPMALAEGIGYSLDIEIDDYALVNMQGFTEIIDAVGGVTIQVDQRVPLPPSIPGEHELPPSIGPCTCEMDGAMAIAYVRSRSGDSDYQRMGRQRQLLAALGSQVSATEALSGFAKVTGSLDDSLRTSLSASGFSGLLERLGDNSSIGESIGLVPPLVPNPGNPDYDEIRTIIDAVQHYVLTGEPSGYAT